MIALSRRRFLCVSFAALPLAVQLQARADVPPLALKAEEVATSLLSADGSKAYAWGFNGKISDLALTLHQFSALPLRLTNALPVPLQLKICGLRFPHGPLDAALAPGESRDAPFPVADSGFALVLMRDSAGQASDPIGAILVPEANPPAVDADVLAIVHETGSPPILSVAGAPASARHSFAPHARIRLRLANACPNRLASIHIEGAAPTVIAIDSQPCELFQPLRNQFPLAPLARFELMFDMPGSAGAKVTFALADLDGAKPQPLLSFEAQGEAKPPPGPIAPLPANSALPTKIALEQALRVDVPLTGKPSVKALFKAKRGQPVVLAFHNTTQATQAARLGGHVGRLLHSLDDGWDPYWRDIVLIAPGKSALLAFVADNIGVWPVETEGVGVVGAFAVE